VDGTHHSGLRHIGEKRGPTKGTYICQHVSAWPRLPPLATPAGVMPGGRLRPVKTPYFRGTFSSWSPNSFRQIATS
jgi:hypothetical protein